MISDNPYFDIIAICSIVIVSYVFTMVAKYTKIPSVLLLIVLGVGIQFLFVEFDITLGPRVFDLLQLLGIVGLIMIVLEAALDLKLTKDKRSLIVKSFFIALFALFGSCISIAWLLTYFLEFNFYTAFIYSIPLSIMSSAIIIPSVSQLSGQKKEFMIYESTFSDILGIMVFYFAIGNSASTAPVALLKEVGINVGLTIGLSIFTSYLLVLLFQRITENARLFLLISVLILLYAVGKMFHLSSLIVILVFGLTLSNYKIFFFGKLRRFIDETVLIRINKEFHLVTLESAFVVRTFFFVIFGLTLDLQSLLNINTAIISLCITAALYIVRFICLKPFFKSILPELFIAPRGLITVLLFFAIPPLFIEDNFSSGILLYTILITGTIMTIGMIWKGDEPADVEELQFTDLGQLDEELSQLRSK
ncbi:MAG TPA: sodium:proton exchanger [Cytophagales bacterium]|nr:sodium:proton exchanger [Cytophagales bacterium]HCR53323.1 sodium:proton exchanger [Cytophagales bacterium]